jgi:hypothetical protein
MAEDRELVATEARDRVVAPERAAQALGDDDEELVAGAVPMLSLTSLKRSLRRRGCRRCGAGA